VYVTSTLATKEIITECAVDTAIRYAHSPRTARLLRNNKKREDVWRSWNNRLLFDRKVNILSRKQKKLKSRSWSPLDSSFS